MENAKIQKGVMLHFGCFDAIFWCIMATFGSYVVALALARGYSKSVISIMVAGYLVSAFSGQFFWSSMCDQLRTNKKVFLIGVSLTFVTQLLLYFSQSQIMFGFLYVCLGFTLQPMGSILDAWMLKALEGNVKAYAPTRGGGSIGHAIAMLVMGGLIARFGYAIMPVCSSMIALLVLIVAIFTPDATFEEKGTRQKISWKTTLSILQERAYLLVLAVVFSLAWQLHQSTRSKSAFWNRWAAM